MTLLLVSSLTKVFRSKGNHHSLVTILEKTIYRLYQSDSHVSKENFFHLHKSEFGALFMHKFMTILSLQHKDLGKNLTGEA